MTQLQAILEILTSQRAMAIGLCNARIVQDYVVVDVPGHSTQGLKRTIFYSAEIVYTAMGAHRLISSMV